MSAGSRHGVLTGGRWFAGLVSAALLVLTLLAAACVQETTVGVAPPADAGIDAPDAD